MLEKEHPLVIVDVGASGGVDKGWETLPANARILAFEPDEAECRRLTEAVSASGERRVEYIPQALGDLSGRRPFYLTASPYCASTFRPLEELASRFDGLSGMLIEQVIEVDLTTLDEWCDARDITTVDYIKLDTQGSELDIIRGGRDVLSSSLVIETEVEFNPLYLDQPLFGQIDAYLRAVGFTFWGFENMHFCSPRGSDLGPIRLAHRGSGIAFPARRPGGQLMWAQAFFVRDELLTGNPHPKLTKQRERAILLARARGLDDLVQTLEHLLGWPISRDAADHATSGAPQNMRELRAELSQVREELDAIRTSRSYRWTLPLRFLGSRFGRIRPSKPAPDGS